MFDDDDQDDIPISTTRYPCMPSLVGLQLMRNRCHLANTGKKLMKWTALATGRELRKLATELQESYKSFREDMRLGYILLARSRYSNPYFNDIVLENIGHSAPIKVEMIFKSFTGVKTRQIYIHETEDDTYPHLGIGRGGEMVITAKKHWRDLLKKIIVICQQRITFTTLETAHKNAQRKKQLIGKVIVPKLKATVAYILSELEEKEREDTFRLKRFMELKHKKRAVNKPSTCANCSCKYDSKDGHVCPVGKSSSSKLPKDDVKVSKSDVITKSEVCEPCTDRKPDIISKSVACKPSNEYKPASIPKTVVCEPCDERKPEIIPKSVICEPCNEPKPGILPKSVSHEPCSEAKKTSSTHQKAESKVPLITKTCSKSESKTNIKSESCKSIPESELGTFENEFKEIIKVIRRQDCDGSIIEEKQVITIRTERRNPRKPDFDKRKSDKNVRSKESHECNSCHNIKPRLTQSEQNRGRNQTREPTCRSFTSSDRNIINRHRTPCSGSCNDSSVKSTPSCNSCYEDTKNSSTMTERNRTLCSSISSPANYAGGRSIAKNKSSCCNSDKLALASCGCNPRTGGRNTGKRDVATSTSGSECKSSSHRQTAFLFNASTSCPSFSKQPCLKKILPSQSCSREVEDELERQRFQLNPKMIESIKNILLRAPITSKNKSNSLHSAQIQERRSTKSSCCQINAESDEEIEITQCTSCGSITIRSGRTTGMDTRSRCRNKEKVKNPAGIIGLLKSKSSRSIKSDTDDESIRRDMARTAKSFNSVCRSREKRSSCPSCPRDSCASCLSQNDKYKDTSTNTKRSTRFDVRGVTSMPIRLRAKKKSSNELKSSCSCSTDNTKTKDTKKVRPIKSPSLFLGA